MILLDYSSPCLENLDPTKSKLKIGKILASLPRLNHLALLRDDFQPWFSLLDGKFLSLNMRDNFVIGVASACIKGVANRDKISMSWEVFSSCVRCSFILSSIEIKLTDILIFVLRCTSKNTDNPSPICLYRSCI